MRLLKTALALTFLGVVGSAFAADNFQAVRAGLPHDAIYSIDRSGDSLWAIGGHGLVLRVLITMAGNGKELRRRATLQLWVWQFIKVNRL